MRAMGESVQLRCNYGLSFLLLITVVLSQYGECFHSYISANQPLESADRTQYQIIKILNLFKILRRRHRNSDIYLYDFPRTSEKTIGTLNHSSSADFDTLVNDRPLFVTRSDRLLAAEAPRSRRASSVRSGRRRRLRRPFSRYRPRYGLTRKHRWKGRRRRGTYKDDKIFIFGQDNRTPVFHFKTRKFPFSNVVKLTTGCTGTLVTPSFVLTAAHCVHDGYAFRTNIEMLKIEVPEAVGYKIYYVDRISIPVGWLKAKNPSESLRAGYDFAVLKLNIPVLGRHNFMKLFIPDPSSFDSDIHFIGFPSYNSPGMWTSRCRISMDMFALDGNLLLSTCDSVAGNSGAAVFTDGRYGRRIIGVLSNSASSSTSNVVSRYSVISSFTWSKLLEICSMIGEEGTDFGVCPPFPNTVDWSQQTLDDREQNALF